MAKKKISKRRERSLNANKKVKSKSVKKTTRVRPLNYLTNKKNVGKAIFECLQNNDPEGVMEVISIYLEALNKSKLIENGEISKSTLYHSLKNKNPTLKTLAKMVSAYSMDRSL